MARPSQPGQTLGSLTAAKPEAHRSRPPQQEPQHPPVRHGAGTAAGATAFVESGKAGAAAAAGCGLRQSWARIVVVPHCRAWAALARFPEEATESNPDRRYAAPPLLSPPAPGLASRPGQHRWEEEPARGTQRQLVWYRNRPVFPGELAQAASKRVRTLPRWQAVRLPQQPYRALTGLGLRVVKVGLRVEARARRSRGVPLSDPGLPPVPRWKGVEPRKPMGPWPDQETRLVERHQTCRQCWAQP